MTCLIDTNVLVYAIDHSDPTRMMRANTVLETVVSAESAVITAQVLAEFANVSLKNVPQPSGTERVYAIVEHYMRAIPVLPLTAAIVLEAVRGVRVYSLSYYDSQIWAVARLNQIPVVLSEDFRSNGTLEGVTFINPFDSAFDPGRLA